MTCTRDDHDTPDPFCGGCGIPLNNPDACEECDLGLHLHGFPFCPCCGVGLEGQKRWTILKGIRNKLVRGYRNKLRRWAMLPPIGDRTEDEKGQ